MKQAKKFGGRPAERELEPGRLTHLSVMLPRCLKRRIEQEARKQGRSISNEAAYRLEQSFDRRDVIEGAVVHALEAIGLVTKGADIDTPGLKVNKRKAK